MIIYNHQKMKFPVVVNFREAAPLAMTASSVPNDRGEETVGIPGLLRGLWESHRQFGKYKWSDLFQTSIRLAKNGMNVTSQLAAAVDQLSNDREKSPLKDSKLFFPKGIPLAENQFIRQPDLASLLDSIAQNGVQGLIFIVKFETRLIKIKCDVLLDCFQSFTTAILGGDLWTR